MSNLLDIQSRLQDTSEAIARFEKAIAKQPDSPSARAMLKSFEKRKRVLEDQFFAAAEEMGTDVCSYRFFSDEVRPSIAPLCSALSEFQMLYSLAYDALKTGPKKRTKQLPRNIEDETAFYFGYTFSGSVGVVLTFDNRQSSLFESLLDEAMRSISELMAAKSSADVLGCGKILGVPTVRAAHRWATTHVESSLGADIGWIKGREVKFKVLLQPEELATLASVIGTTAETISEDLKIQGTLLGADVQKRHFHFALPDVGEIRGKFSQSISPSQTFEVGRNYKVVIRKRVKLYYSTEREEDATYQLVMATPA